MYYDIDGKPFEDDNEGRQYFVKLFDGASARYSRRVAHHILSNGLYISTVFLGINYGFGDGSKPLLFETMAFIQPNAKKRKRTNKQANKFGYDIAWERWSTQAEALAGHNAIVALYSGQVAGIKRRKRWTNKG